MRNSIELCTGIALAVCACGAAQETQTETTSTAAAEEQPAARGVEAEAVPPTAPAPAPPAGIAPVPALDATESASAEPPTRLNDGQIGEVLDTVDEAEIAAGELVMERSQNQAVKELAAGVVKAHKKTHRDMAELMLRENIRPEKSDLSRSLSDQAEATLERLETLEGAELDRAYINGQVTTHQELLAVVDRTLVPNAQKQDLETYVAALRPMLSAHLQHASALEVALAAR